jgi:hypothetical protein
MNQNIFKAFLKQQGLPLRRFHESMFLAALRLLSVRIVWFASGGPGPAEPFFFESRALA